VDPAFGNAVDALNAGDDEGAFSTLTEGDKLTLDLLIWMQLRDRDVEAPFGSYDSFLSIRPNWPGNSRIRANAERLIDPDQTPTEMILAFFDGQNIETGQGAVVYANALIEFGRTEEAHAMLVDVLLNDALTTASHQAIINAFPDVVAPHHSARADMLLWRWRVSDATNVIPLLDEGEQALMRARIAIINRDGDVQRREALVPDRLAGDPHYIAPDEANYSDLEWLSGYLALTYMKDFERALIHFQNFDASVSSPISEGRAGYWLGRAYEGLGDADAAIAAFQAGAEHQTSFYGQLSAERLGLTMDPDIAGGEDFGDWRGAPILNNDLVRAGLHLLDVGERGLAVLFLRDAAKTMSRQEIGQLGQLLMDVDEPFYAILIAKSAVREGLLVQDVYFPIHPMAELDLPVEPALALAIARQESEFRVDAGSSVGALGLMQLMPATAQDVAGWLDLPYSRNRLTSDWPYNAALGSEYLAYLTREFGNSPVMIAAGYNAGPSRPKRWMDSFGDPRRGFGNDDPVDIIDWIEHIPFRETRNYVMRVTEGIPVYRARLSGRIGPVQFTDLLIGELPVIRPVARPARSIDDVVEEALQTDTAPSRPPVRRAGEIGPAAPSGPQSVRPVARAGE